MAILKSGSFLKVAIFLLFTLALWLPIVSAQAESVKLDEKKIEAGLVYNFLKYTNWQAPAAIQGKNTLKVCLLGGDPFSGYLSPLEGRTAQQYVIQITRLDTAAEALDCNLVFIHQSQEDNLSGVLQAFKGKNILTLSNIEHFSQKGGMVEFSTGADKRIHLYINRETVDSSGIVIGPRLLNLAELERAG